jgi:hypothetical protein
MGGPEKPNPVRGAGALTSPAILSPRERMEKGKKRTGFFLYPLSPFGREG